MGSGWAAWGPMIGDEGSGYYMGRKALHALTWHRDGYRKSCPELAWCVRRRLERSPEHWGEIWRELHVSESDAADADAWVDFLVPYSQDVVREGVWRYSVSDLVKAVIEAAELERENGKPDGVASTIIHKSVSHIAERLALAVVKAGLGDQPFPVVLAGGVVTHNRVLKDALATLIAEQLPNAQIHAPAQDGPYHYAVGAALHALAKGFDHLPPADVCARVKREARKALGD